MVRALAAAVATFAAAFLLAHEPRGRFVQLAPGVIEIHTEMVLEDGAEVRGAAAGSTLRAAADFRGRAPAQPSRHQSARAHQPVRSLHAVARLKSAAVGEREGELPLGEDGVRLAQLQAGTWRGARERDEEEERGCEGNGRCEK